jgi:serine/threonine-protein kinase
MSPDKKAKRDDWKKSHILRLADDIVITSVSELPESMREEILKDGKTADGYYGIERQHVRALPKIVNQNIVDVLRAFGETGATYEQVFEYFAEARNLERDKFDADLSGLVTNLIHSSFLVDGDMGSENGSDSVEPSFEPGEEWLDYRIVENVKTMVDSEIYKVEHIKTGQPGALKIMQSRFPNKGMKKKIRQRLKHEFDVIQKIDHPNVVRLHKHGAHQERKYGILDWVDGPAVREFAHKSDDDPDPELLLRLAIECVQALSAVHKAGYLHGDVHTGNFLVRQGHVCLIDFGLSRPIVIGEKEKSKYSEGGVALYMPPEYVRMAFNREKGLWGSVQSEVYSCGVVLFSLFTKRYPYEWKFYRKDYMQSVLDDPPLSFEECKRPAWPELETVIRKALAKNREDRFVSMDDFLKALSAVKDSLVKSA